jgi:hypothetical protein
MTARDTQDIIDAIDRYLASATRVVDDDQIATEMQVTKYDLIIDAVYHVDEYLKDFNILIPRYFSDVTISRAEDMKAAQQVEDSSPIQYVDTFREVLWTQFIGGVRATVSGLCRATTHRMACDLRLA